MEKIFEGNNTKLKVICVTQSQPFIIVSYRRACKYCQRLSPEYIQASGSSDISDQCECTVTTQNIATDFSENSVPHNPLLISTSLIGKKTVMLENMLRLYPYSSNIYNVDARTTKC